MIQGSNMTRSHKGMRKGLSLMEMLVAIVLFGIMGTISYTYYKVFYDTSFAAKQLRVYTIVDQAAQLNNAFELYNTKNGEDINDTVDLVTDKILTQIPVNQPSISTDGWRYDANKSVTSASGGGGKVFIYDINATQISNQDKMDYCNILNEVALKTYNLDSNTTDALEGNTTNNRYTDGLADPLSEMEYFHCADNNTSETYLYEMVFILRAEVADNL